ncbi:hypothetical protein Tco_1503237 [Tanacetum coccineum]
MATNEETYDQPLAMTTTNIFEVNYEDAYDQNVDRRPNAAKPRLSNGTCHPPVFTRKNIQTPMLSNLRLIDNTIPYHQNLLDTVKPQKCSNEEQALVIQRNKRNAELVQENDLLKSTLSGKEKSIAFLQSEKEKILSEKKDLADSYLDEIKPKAATADLHKDLLGTRNPGLGYIAKRAQPVLYDADTLLHPAHHPVRIWDSEDVLNMKLEQLKDQLQGKDDTIRNLQTQINITRMLNVGSTVGSFDKQALETEITQLKDALTSVRIQIDGYKAENVNLKRRYEELSKSNAYSRSTFIAKINALTAENAKLKTELSGKKTSGSTASEKPKVLASGMYTNSSKYIPPPKRANWVKPTPLPKKKQVTFQEPPRTSNRPTQKPPVQQNKKPNVSVNLSTRTKPATESRKPMPKSHTRNHRILPSKSVNARRAADHNRKLNVVDHNQFVIRSLKSVNTKTPQAKHSVNHTKKVWKATRNHTVNTTKTAWRPTGKVVGSVKPQWKPTGRHFALYDNCPLTRIMEPIVEPLELTPSVSSSSKVTMISRFTDCKLSDRKAGSKGLSDCTTNRLQVQDRLQYHSCLDKESFVSMFVNVILWNAAERGCLYHLGIRLNALAPPRGLSDCATLVKGFPYKYLYKLDFPEAFISFRIFFKTSSEHSD